MLTLPLALRQHYLQHGYAVVRSAQLFGAAHTDGAASMIESLRKDVLAATNARAAEFLTLPSIETVVKNSARLQDPTYEKMYQRLTEYQHNRKRHAALRRRYRLLKRRRAAARAGQPTASTAASGDDIWALTQAVYAELQSTRNPKLCRSTVDNDPQMAKAIALHRVNLWMTHRGVEEAIRGDIGKAIGRVASEVAGVETPVLFSDRPIARPMFGTPYHFHCAMPSTGVDRTQSPTAAVYLVMHAMHATAMQPFVMRNSHVAVREQLAPGQPKASQILEALHLTFLPMESHMPFAAQHFTFSNDVESVPVDGLAPGDLLVVDPCTMIGFGPNVVPRDNAVLRLHVVPETARPDVSVPSWVRDWRSSASRIDFQAAAVFPKLY